MTAGVERPPFGPGNTAGLVHGAYSEQAIAERAEQVHVHLLEIAPWTSELHYAPSVNRYVQATAREALAHEALMAMEPGAKGFTRLMEAATAASRLAWFMGDALGLTPTGHARLKMLVAGAEHAEASLADLSEAGRRARLGAADADASAEDDDEEVDHHG
jgi:hypothetical protein